MSMLHKTAKPKSNSQAAKKAPTAAQRAARERFKAMVAARRHNDTKPKRSVSAKPAAASAPRAPEKKMAKKAKKRKNPSRKRRNPGKKAAKKGGKPKRASKPKKAAKPRKSPKRVAAGKKAARTRAAKKAKPSGKRPSKGGVARRMKTLAKLAQSTRRPKMGAIEKAVASILEKVKNADGTPISAKAAWRMASKRRNSPQKRVDRLRLKVMKAQLSPSLAALAKKHGLRSNPDGMLGQLKALLPEIAVGMLAFGIAAVGAHKLAPKLADKAPDSLKKWVPTMLAIGLGGATFAVLSRMGGKSKMAAPYALAAGAAAGMMHMWMVKDAAGVSMGSKLGLPIALGEYVVGDYHMGNYVLGGSPDFTVGNYVLGSPGEQFYIQGADDGIFSGIEHQNARRIEAPADAMQRHDTRRDVEGVLSGTDDGIFG
jgi:hypothetical protein